MRATGWIDQVRDLPVVEIAQRLGLELHSGPSVGPCPGCGAPRRSMSNPAERRGPVGVTHNGLGWRCHRCDAHGDAIELVRLSVGAGDLRAWFQAQGLVAASGPLRRVRPKTPPPMPTAPLAPAAPELRPPRAEIAELWRRCRPVTEDPAAVRWMTAPKTDGGRGWPLVTVDRIAELDLARALPAGDLPEWARFGRGGGPWSDTGHRLLVALWDADGELVSVRARYCRTTPTTAPKSLSPYRTRPDGEEPYSVRGVVMADPVGRDLLRTGTVPDWCGCPENLVLWVAEGEPDFLRLATWWGDADETARVVWGISAGGQTPAVLARIPSGCRVIVATDPDRAGEKYARALCDALGGRCRVERYNHGGASEPGH